MAAVQSASASSSSSLLSRTRSTRVPAKQPVDASTAGAVSSAATIPTSVSNVSLFLTNLRLLDLDLLPDWPGINGQTFSAKDAAQGQKKRIQSVEWALYQLFVLWDADDARNKLQPFFPPLDQVQSLNLRAALLRSLEQVKKSGLLGRDAVVRKTMLDECRGERLEEVLAVFSSAVLKKLVAEQQLNEPGHPAISQRIALENRGYSAERTELNALVLAHKGSLTRLLREKKAANARYEDFAELLALKRRSVARRREQVKSLKGQTDAEKDGLDDEARLDVWRTVRNNWSGNERWMETLLYGDANSRKDGLLVSPYDRVWRRVQSGRLAELEDQSGGLLEQLDNRIRAQRERLSKWESFHKSHFGQANKDDTTQQKAAQPLNRQKGLDLGFGAHETLYPGRMSPRKQLGQKPTTLGREYSNLIDSFTAELASIDNENAQPFLAIQRPRKAKEQRSPPRLSIEDPAAEEVISELSELEDEPAADSRPEQHQNDPQPEASQLVSKTSSHENQRPSRPVASGGAERKPRPHLPQNFSASSRASTPSPVRSPIRSPIHSPVHKLTRSPTRSPIRAAASQPVETPVFEESVSPTQQLADQIIASMSAVSPSPIKISKPRHTLSLAERTRLSMARGSRTSSFEEDEPDLDTPSLGLGRSQLSQSPEKRMPGGLEDVVEGEAEDLVARTRKSMVNFEAARQKAQLERRRSQRKSRQQPSRGGEGGRASYFPPVEEGDTTLLAEEMMAAGEDDYEAVFMSRPKIKTSPVTTPIKGWN